MASQLLLPVPSLCRVHSSHWAWFILLLWLCGLTLGLGASPATKPIPRSAFVSLAREHDLAAILASITQLEDTFNDRYHYHWIFFGLGPLSENFRVQTSNATNATCLYEVAETLSVDKSLWADILTSTLQPQRAPRDMRVDTKAVVAATNRWKSGLFAREKRLRNYDWFWRIDPGVSLALDAPAISLLLFSSDNRNSQTQFTHDIPFDIFRFMRDREIAMGHSRPPLSTSQLNALSPHITSFISRYPDLLHAEADLSWLRDRTGGQVPSESTCGLVGDDDDRYVLVRPRGSILGTSIHARHSEADLRQEDGEAGSGAEEADAGSVAEAFASWLSSMYETRTSPSIEMGSLAFFRSPAHQVLLDHLDSSGDFFTRRALDVPVQTLSASMFLPKHSVWSYTKKEGRYRTEQPPSVPNATPDPDRCDNDADEWDGEDIRTKARRDSPQQAQDKNKNLNEGMGELYARWELLARDFVKKSEIPSLRSGDTVIDKRNFELS